VCWGRFGRLLSQRKACIASRPPLLALIGPVNLFALNVTTLTTPVFYALLIVPVSRRASTPTLVVVPIPTHPVHPRGVEPTNCTLVWGRFWLAVEPLIPHLRPALSSPRLPLGHPSVFESHRRRCLSDRFDAVSTQSVDASRRRRADSVLLP